MRASINPQFLINQRREKVPSVATALLYATEANWVHEGDEMEVPVLTITEVEVDRMRMPDILAVRDFCERISKLTGVEAVMVEEIQEGVQHVTTFLAERSPELEAQIYEIEASIIQTYRDGILDFHVRVAPRDETGSPEFPDGSYYLLIWRAA